MHISSRGQRTQVHVCVSMHSVVSVLLKTILPCVCGAECFVLFDCSSTASAITHELLPYSNVGRAMVEQREALKAQTALCGSLCLKKQIHSYFTGTSNLWRAFSFEVSTIKTKKNNLQYL